MCLLSVKQRLNIEDEILNKVDMVFLLIEQLRVKNSMTEKSFLAVPCRMGLMRTRLNPR